MFIFQKSPLFSSPSKKDESVVCHYLTAINTIKKRYFSLLTVSLGLGMLTLSTTALASYAPEILTADSGYYIKLNSTNSTLTGPIVASNGHGYYRVGKPIIIDRNYPAVGEVKCIGRTWGSGSNLKITSDPYHRLFVYVPQTNFKLEGKATYRINNNIVMTLDSKMSTWAKLGTAGVCGELPNLNKKEGVKDFGTHFPFTLTFYIDEKIIDGQIVFPAMGLAGYVRAFTNTSVTPPYNSWPIGETSAPVWLESSQIALDSACKTSTSTGEASTINLRHGSLSSKGYDSSVTETITYTCKFSKSTGIRMRLDYATDDDPQKRLPMTSKENPDNKIYSELTLTDDSTGQSGKELKVTIDAVKTISVNSHIKGENAAAGSYRGSAWLIATFD